MTTLSYETAKTLKEANFPQLGTFLETKTEDGVLKGCTGKGGWIEEDCGRHDSCGDCDCDSHERTYIPTLPELIEACGDKFAGLARTHEGEWFASSNDYLTERFPTPEEAVANLWLALQSPRCLCGQVPCPICKGETIM